MGTQEQVEKHSPLPWRLHEPAFRFIIAADGMTICRMFNGLPSATRLNAELIVKAVNERAELIATLENIADKVGRAALVQDRSVGIIKQVCALVAKDAHALLDKVNKQ